MPRFLIEREIPEQGRFPKRNSGKFPFSRCAPCSRWGRRSSGYTVTSPRISSTASIWLRTKPAFGSTREKQAFLPIAFPPYAAWWIRLTCNSRNPPPPKHIGWHHPGSWPSPFPSILAVALTHGIPGRLHSPIEFQPFHGQQRLSDQFAQMGCGGNDRQGTRRASLNAGGAGEAFQRPRNPALVSQTYEDFQAFPECGVRGGMVASSQATEPRSAKDRAIPHRSLA